MEGWRASKLGDIAAISYGYTAKASLENVGPKFLRITDIQNDMVDWSSVPYCPIGEADLKKHKLKDQDIVFARTGATTGKSYLVYNPPESIAASYLIRLRVEDSTVSAKFVSKYFQTSEYWDGVSSGISGSAQGGFNASKLAALVVPIPPLLEQKRIVAIVDEAFEGIDRAIANTQKNLTNAREIFESYLQALDAEKEPLGELVDIKTGKLDANAATENGQYPFFTCSREIYSIDKYAFDCEAILLAGNNAIGDFNVKHYKGKFNAYQRTYVITVNKENRVLYRYLYFQLLKSLKEFKSQAVGAGTKFLKLGMIKDLQIALPTIEEQQEIVSVLDALATETQRLEAIYQQKLVALNELKQAILQKAFTGELTADTANQATKTAKEVIAA